MTGEPLVEIDPAPASVPVSVSVPVPAPPPAASPWRRALFFWRSPQGQPAWARPALLVLTVVSGLAYGWRMGSSIEVYYAAAVRSMSMSWHDFIFGAFDPAGTISVDKLPGALWLQALSVRIFGVHTWAVALPQVLEGSLTVLVLFRTVRRLAGPAAGLIAAGVLAFSPAVVTLDRGNISDTLLVLLLVLAADSTVAALQTGRWRSVGMAGVWVGLAFQAKMVEAWLVLPALAAVLLFASAGAPRTRLLRVLAMVVITGAVSFSWMLFVTLTPASQRPYVDGSQHNSVFAQVFDYNGFGRVGQPSPNAELGRTLDIPFLARPEPRPRWDRLLTGSYGRDSGLAAPCFRAGARGRAARAAATAPDRPGAGGDRVVGDMAGRVRGGVHRQRHHQLVLPRGPGAPGGRAARDRLRVGLGATSRAVDPGGTPRGGPGHGGVRRLAPARDRHRAPGLVGTGRTGARHRRRGGARRLSPPAPSPQRGGAGRRGRRRGGGPRPGGGFGVGGGQHAGTVRHPVPVRRENPVHQGLFRCPAAHDLLVPTLEQAQAGAPDLIATQTSVLAAPFIYATGEEVLPIGGYTGHSPEPSVRRLAAEVAHGDFHLVITAATSKDPRVAWVDAHCLKVPTPADAAGAGVALPLAIHYCTPRS